jgi:hypothetical protein
VLTEETVTKTILDLLELDGWTIACFDYPQSGTGIYFSHEDYKNVKNKNSINPDIIAVKNGIALYFENKAYYYLKDIELIKKLKNYNPYRKSMDYKLKITRNCKFYYGIGIYYTENTKKLLGRDLRNNSIDFVYFVKDNKDVCVVRNH